MSSWVVKVPLGRGRAGPQGLMTSRAFSQRQAADVETLRGGITNHQRIAVAAGEWNKELMSAKGDLVVDSL